MYALYFLACLGPFLSNIWSDQIYQGIYGIRGTCQTYLSTLCDQYTQVSMHACYILLCRDSYLGQIGQNREIKIFMKPWGHTRHVWAQNISKAHKLVCMHAIFLHAQAHILAKLGEIRKIKLSIESGEHAWHFWADNWFKHISQWACELYSCMQGPITRSNWVRSERLRYLWNQGNILDISELQYYPNTQASMHKHYNLAWMDW